MTRKTLIVLLALLPIAFAMPANAQIANDKEAAGDMSLGSKDAPVIIYAFESLTCPHCRAFHKGAYDEIKNTYVTSGKVRIVFKDYPLDNRAFYGTVIARCTGRERYVGMVETLFENQASWSRAPGAGFEQALRSYWKLAGLTDADFTKCVKNQKLISQLAKQIRGYSAKYKIKSTPTFLIGTAKTIETDDAKRIEGAVPFADFKRVIDETLSKATKK